jgi:hypothetical protein
MNSREYTGTQALERTSTVRFKMPSLRRGAECCFRTLGALALPAILVLAQFPALALSSREHYRLTYQSAIHAGFSPAAAKVLAQGSVYADWFDWNTPAAHAQTPNDANGYPTQAIRESVMEYRSYLSEKTAQVLVMLSAGSFGDALFRTGYLLHAIQDLSAHEGITNAWHGAIASQPAGSCGPNPCSPDSDPDRISRAGRWTDTFFLEAQTWMGPVYSKLKLFNGEGPTLDEKRSAAISGPDMSLGNLAKDALHYRFELPGDALRGHPLPPSGRWSGGDGVGKNQQVEAIRILAQQSIRAGFSRGVGYSEASSGQDFINPVRSPGISRIRNIGTSYSCSKDYLDGVKPMSFEVCNGVCNWPAAFSADDCSSCLTGIAEQQSLYKRALQSCASGLGGSPGVSNTPATAEPSQVPNAKSLPSTRGSTSISFNEADLQRQRLNAVNSGDIETYNRLIDKHRLLYKQHGIDPCRSGFFPQGCSH